MEKKDWFKSVLVYLCITFFIFTLAFVYMSLRGRPQAGLIEVGGCSVLFVIFLHVIKRVLPSSASIIASILSIVIALSLIFANFHLQKSENIDYTLKEIIVGELLAKKFFKVEIEDQKPVYKEFDNENFEPIDHVRTRTEKFTLESSFEKPEKMDLGDKPMGIDIEDATIIKPATASIDGTRLPNDDIEYKLKIVAADGLSKENGEPVMFASNMVIDDKQSVLIKNIQANFSLPTDSGINHFSSIIDKSVEMIEEKSSGLESLPYVLEDIEKDISEPINIKEEHILKKP